MSKTCMQRVIVKMTQREVLRRRPHIVPDATFDPNNGYARCESCGTDVYVGTGLHPNLGVPMDQADDEAAYLLATR